MCVNRTDVKGGGIHVRIGSCESGISPSSILHPLEPLTAEEITAAVHIVRTERNLHERVRFASIALHEPAKEVVLNFKQGVPITRSAFIILLDNMDGATYEAIVLLLENLTEHDIMIVMV